MLLLSISTARYPVAFRSSAFSDISIGHQVVFSVEKHPDMFPALGPSSRPEALSTAGIFGDVPFLVVCSCGFSKMLTHQKRVKVINFLSVRV